MSKYSVVMQQPPRRRHAQKEQDPKNDSCEQDEVGVYSLWHWDYNGVFVMQARTTARLKMSGVEVSLVLYSGLKPEIHLAKVIL